MRLAAMSICAYWPILHGTATVLAMTHSFNQVVLLVSAKQN